MSNSNSNSKSSFMVELLWHNYSAKEEVKEKNVADYLDILERLGNKAVINADFEELGLLRMKLENGEERYAPVTCSKAFCFSSLLENQSVEMKHMKQRSYVVSVYAWYVLYAVDEIVLHVSNKIIAFALLGVISCLGGIFWLFGLDRCVNVNNLLLSTNLWGNFTGYYDSFFGESIKLLTKSRPNDAVLFRCIDEEPVHADLLETLKQQNCMLIFARQINYLDPEDPEVWKKRAVKGDIQLLVKNAGADAKKIADLLKMSKNKEGLPDSRPNLDASNVQSNEYKNRQYDRIFLKPCTPIPRAVIDRLLVLYSNVYLKKYSLHNPIPTPEYYERLIYDGVFQFMVLRRRPCNSNRSEAETQEEQVIDGTLQEDDAPLIDGFICLFERNGIMTTPMLGYDTSLPPALGLYPMLTLNILLEGKWRGALVNMSGGVSHFKRVRGAHTIIEYNAIYVDHLPWYRRFVWKGMELLSKYVVVPIIKRKRGEKTL